MAAFIGAADPRPGAFAVGVLRRDGLLIPFATFDGKRWSSAWPSPTKDNLEIPIDLSSVPKRWWGPTQALADWQAWTGAEPRTVRVQQPDWLDVHCLRQIVLRTDYRSDQPPPPTTEQPYPKDGLAVSPPQAVERIEIVPRDAVEVRNRIAGAQDLLGMLRDAFNRAERETAARFAHPVKEKAREGIEPNIEAVYAFGKAPRAYYVEASRGYRTTLIREGECAIAFGTGWFLRDTTQLLHQADMAVDLLPCDRYGASYMLPLGAIRIADRTFWVVQYSGWNQERFVIIEIKKEKVEAVLNVFGGAC